MTISRGVAVTLATMAFLAPLHATSGTIGVSVPVAHVDIGVYYNPGSDDYPGLGEVTHTTTLGTVSAAAYATPLPTVEVSGSTGALGNNLVANAYMAYWFVILSAQPGYAEVLIDANARAYGTGSYMASAEVGLTGGHAMILAYAHACNNICATGDVYTSGGTRAVEVQLNQFYEFILSADAHTTNSFSSFYASVDPTITFDPAYAIPAGATIALSPGFAATAVPEAASWALLLAGFGMVGGMTRLGKRARVAA